LTLTKATTFKSLRRQLEEQFDTKLRFKYSDSDGDQLSIKREADFQDCIADVRQRGLSRIKFYLYARETRAETSGHGSGHTTPSTTGGADSSTARLEMFSMFEFILDPVVVIAENGIVQYVNKKVEHVLGYSQADLIGKNVNIIMTEDQRPYHDTFLRNYLKTGVSRIIGIGRDVIALKKDGSIMPVHLEVTERSMGTGKLFFIGIMKEAKAQIQEKSLIQQEREVLYTLTVPAIIIDQTGAVNGFNKSAQDLLGFTLVEIIGKNISMIMPSPHRDAHDGYLKTYMETGVAKIIGIGRKLVAQHKDGTLLPVFLSVTEKRDKDKRFFTGILQEVQTAIAVTKSSKT
jgi:PAS domain S-box-containing protein